MNKKTYILVLSLLFVFGLLSSAYAFKVRFTWYNGTKYVYLTDVAAYYNMKPSVSKTSSALTSRYSKIEARHGSKELYLNNRKIFLSMPTIYNGGKPAISETDFLLLLDPILRKAALKRHKLTTVVIDPGHGGKDNGARGKRHKEKNVAYSIALKLKNLLKANGFKVIMTRNKDVFIPLKSRPAMCRKYGGDIFISIHCNSAGKSIRGVETFVYTPVGTISTHGGKAASGKQYGNGYDKNNARLGYEIQKSIINSSKYRTNDRGLKRSQFAVLKYCPVPAVLVETGFLSNRTEEQLLGTYGYQNEVARSIAKGIISYRNAMRAGKN